MKKLANAKLTAILLFVCCVFLFTACSNAPENPINPSVPEALENGEDVPTANGNDMLSPIAPEAELTVASTDTKVAEFLEINEGFSTYYETDTCYNITPDFVAENSDFAIFKYDTSTESFVMYDGEIHSIGTCFGGYGITGMALADLNNDGQYELYYTFSWGSGLHRSQIGYFDPASKDVTVFEDYALLGFDCELMLTVNEAGDLCVNSAEISQNSFVDYSMRAAEPIGTIVWTDTGAELNIENSKFSIPEPAVAE